ncbi:hypothetical protein BCV69DRAFT_281195 [Microstroma glucosiphilum]|uniref:ATP synthase subunit K, mitochondrial n=1 Tax=Pseudomicrostroma glucosiphilum TaxID=1684307 RepID=A0A316UAJ9_9BASI|nr:hypothetical protein BCV69DRAFT_281195 [Pseudomicrostroma glucosiphilum]PWN22189.1 hypothetical protein BCV69DRAFT_281195 [Pseudomicrostroma glucosiphilum]
MSYTIAGKKILNEHLALGIFGLYGLGGFLATRGGSEPKPAGGAAGGPKSVDPPINAASSDEEAFIKNFLAEAEGHGDKSGERLV